ncbi:cytochrome P450 9e2 isoform X1 [Culex quinquefasciatus]|uniref:cytochrome P450 9e2 isoform X1 n=1 Tax=Culex quinquefasciatus TaxID=7176 RepID=UPI0018E36E35|nr:cytochrome P450 9e2 isoform X1 [Culex quinquefasciatus]
MIGLFCVGAIFLLLYYILFLNHNYFGKRGVPHHKAVPILGNAAPYVLQKRHISEVLQELCDAFPKHGFFGYFDFWCPVYMVKDVELVKKICIKDFNHFVNHRTQFSAEHDPLFANSLFSMNDSRWRNMRSVLSPAFTGTWNDDDLAAQCTVFLFAGFETVATLTSFMAHELAINSTVQAKLRAEVDATRAKLNGRRPTYEIIQEMTYLDMVVTETLRKWPPVPFLDRRCTKPYLLEDLDGSSVQLQPGDSIWIPTTAIMRNPKYFPQPEKFDPERFSVENRGTIDPNAFISFGVGPRNCIGSRFALMETKTTFFYLLSRFTIESGPKTQHPLEIKTSSITMQAKNGFWVRFRKRS